MNERSYSYWTDHAIVQCAGCHTTSFCQETWNSLEVQFDLYSQSEEMVRVQKLYPLRLPRERRPLQSHTIPRQVAAIYRETHSALQNNLPILVGIGLRAIVEAVCKQARAKGNLEKGIDRL